VLDADGVVGIKTITRSDGGMRKNIAVEVEREEQTDVCVDE